MIFLAHEFSAILVGLTVDTEQLSLVVADVWDVVQSLKSVIEVENLTKVKFNGRWENVCTFWQYLQLLT